MNVFVDLVVDLLFGFRAVEVICRHEEADVRNASSDTL